MGCVLSLMIAYFSILVIASSENNPAITASLLTQNPNPARAGDIVDLRIKLENSGG